MPKLFLIATDGGDGSRDIECFDDRSVIENLIESDPETYSDGDGGNITEMTFPDDFDLNSIGGITILTAADVDAQIAENAD